MDVLKAPWDKRTREARETCSRDVPEPAIRGKTWGPKSSRAKRMESGADGPRKRSRSCPLSLWGPGGPGRRPGGSGCEPRRSFRTARLHLGLKKTKEIDKVYTLKKIKIFERFQEQQLKTRYHNRYTRWVYQVMRLFFQFFLFEWNYNSTLSPSK